MMLVQICRSSRKLATQPVILWIELGIPKHFLISTTVHFHATCPLCVTLPHQYIMANLFLRLCHVSFNFSRCF